MKAPRAWREMIMVVSIRMSSHRAGANMNIQPVLGKWASFSGRGQCLGSGCDCGFGRAKRNSRHFLLQTRHHDRRLTSMRKSDPSYISGQEQAPVLRLNSGQSLYNAGIIMTVRL